MHNKIFIDVTVQKARIERQSATELVLWPFPVMFKDDVSDYNSMRRVYFSHSNSTEDKLSSQHDDDGDMIRKSTKPIRLSHLIAFNVKENHTVISGILTIEFEYYSSDGSIKYRDMHYSDPRLIKHIEGNPRVMRNIDSYLRKNLLEAEYGLKLMS